MLLHSIPDMAQPGTLQRTQALRQAGPGSTSGLLRKSRLRHMRSIMQHMRESKIGV